MPPSYDDYDYGEVNQLLERSLKVYIKTVACYPEKTTKRMYAQFWRHFKHSEKVLTPTPPTPPPDFPLLWGSGAQPPHALTLLSCCRSTSTCCCWRPGCRLPCCMPCVPSHVT